MRSFAPRNKPCEAKSWAKPLLYRRAPHHASHHGPPRGTPHGVNLVQCYHVPHTVTDGACQGHGMGSPMVTHGVVAHVFPREMPHAAPRRKPFDSSWGYAWSTPRAVAWGASMGYSMATQPWGTPYVIWCLFPIGPSNILYAPRCNFLTPN